MKWLPLTLSIMLCFMVSCSSQDDLKPPTNPYDPNNPDYEVPIADVTGTVSDGAVLDTSAVTLTWRGNSTAYEYSYQLYFSENGYSEWSDWTLDTCATLRYLDEGAYMFLLRARTNQTVPVVGDNRVFHFGVDAIKGPALRIFPLYYALTVGKEGEIELMAEEVDSLMGAELHVEFDPAIIRVEDVLYSPFLYDEELGISFREIDNEVGTVKIVVVRGSGAQPTVSGTGTLAILEVTGLAAGSTEIRLTESCAYRNADNEAIGIRQKTMGIVKVE